MPFNPEKPYGTVCGGVFDQCAVQDGKHYEKDGTEVIEVDGKRQTVESKEPKTAKGKAADPKSKIEDQISE